MLEKIMWYFGVSLEEAEEIYPNLTDSQLVEIDNSHYAWIHNIDY